METALLLSISAVGGGVWRCYIACLKSVLLKLFKLTGYSNKNRDKPFIHSVSASACLHPVEYLWFTQTSNKPTPPSQGVYICHNQLPFEELQWYIVYTTKTNYRHYRASILYGFLLTRHLNCAVILPYIF